MDAEPVDEYQINLLIEELLGKRADKEKMRNQLEHRTNE